VNVLLYIAVCAALVTFIAATLLVHSARERDPIKVFEVNDCDWIAARSLKEACDFYQELTGLDDEDAFGCDGREGVTEVPAETMDRLKFVNHDEGYQCTFRQELDRQIANGAQAPFFFASTEY
jgi:hypothetical protein